MVRELILGTAGHIDHGKTSLIKALTGVDCDRLPEEKARGITIDIGFASLRLGDFQLGIVDVPGHERFIKNMLAGATGIDLALLIVAADDSIMPQTREHLEILKLLNLRQGVVAVTKSDLVDDDTREVVIMEIRELLAGSFLASAPIIATSATTGAGLDELRDAILQCCQRVEVAEDPGNWPFRMAIDRSFIMQGHGTVVTGSVTSGRVRVGDELDWLPMGRRVRVRSLHNHDQPVIEVHRGMRAALNLAGVDHAEVARGQEVAAPGYLKPTRTLTVTIHASRDLRRALKHRTPVRLHIGTAEVMAIAALLTTEAIPPGGNGLGQLFTEEPVTATWNQPFVLRESSAATTLGGGNVLQPVARKIMRSNHDSVSRLEGLAGDAPPDRRVAAVAWTRGIRGLDANDLVREAGVLESTALSARLIESGQLTKMLIGARPMMLHEKAIEDVEGRVLSVLRSLHEAQPLVNFHDRSRVVARLDYLGDDQLIAAVIDRMIAGKKLIGDARRIARADFKPRLSANLQKLKDAIVAAHLTGRFQPPYPKDFANQAGGNAKSLKDVFEVAVAEGQLAAVADDLFLHAQCEREMRDAVLNRLANGSAGLTVADIRDLLNTTRKFAVPLCEYLDRVGVTRRVGDLRVAAQELASLGE